MGHHQHPCPAARASGNTFYANRFGMKVKTSKTLELSKKSALAGLTFNMPHQSPERPSGIIQQKWLHSGQPNPKGAQTDQV